MAERPREGPWGARSPRRGRRLGARGHHAEAADLARAAAELAESTDDTNMCADNLMDLARVLAAVGDSAERADALRRAAALYERKGNVVSADLARRSEAPPAERPPRVGGPPAG